MEYNDNDNCCFCGDKLIDRYARHRGSHTACAEAREAAPRSERKYDAERYEQ